MTRWSELLCTTGNRNTRLSELESIALLLYPYSHVLRQSLISVKNMLALILIWLMFYYQIHVHAIVPSVQTTFTMYSYVLMFIPTCLVIKINSSLFAILPQCLSVQTAPVNCKWWQYMARTQVNKPVYKDGTPWGKCSEPASTSDISANSRFQWFSWCEGYRIWLALRWSSRGIQKIQKILPAHAFNSYIRKQVTKGESELHLAI